MKFALSAVFLFCLLVCSSLPEAEGRWRRGNIGVCCKKKLEIAKTLLNRVKSLRAQFEEMDYLPARSCKVIQRFNGYKFAASAIAELKTRVETLQSQVKEQLPTSDLKEDVQNVDLRTEGLSTEVEDLRQRVDSLGNGTDAERVIFSAAVTSAATGTFSEGETIVFSNERLDTQNNYNNDTGTFVAPTNGTYAFQFSSKKAQFDMFVRVTRGEEIVWERNVLFGSQFSSTGGGIFLPLEKGDEVSAVCGSADGCGSPSVEGSNCLTFSGFLLPETTA